VKEVKASLYWIIAGLVIYVMDLKLVIHCNKQSTRYNSYNKLIMKKTILLSLLMIFLKWAYCQEYEYIPFPTENAIWSEIYYPGFEKGDPSLERFAINGEDTTINNMVYKKLFLFYDTVFNVKNATYFGGIREDSTQRIYFKCEKILHQQKPLTDLNGYDEMILFDFSLNIGDTVNNSKELLVFNWRYEDTLIIKNIDTVLIGGKLRKRFQFENYFWVNWIEGIGSNMGLLFTSGDLPFNGVSGNLICFKQNNEILYLNGNECMPVISAIKAYEQDILKMEIFPNPTKQIINILFPAIETGRLFVFNTLGEKVFSTVVFYAENKEIHLPCLNTGIYNVVFISKSHKKSSSKLIIKK
jgi:hypothetical protein